MWWRETCLLAMPSIEKGMFLSSFGREGAKSAEKQQKLQSGKSLLPQEDRKVFEILKVPYIATNPLSVMSNQDPMAGRKLLYNMDASRPTPTTHEPNQQGFNEGHSNPHLAPHFNHTWPLARVTLKNNCRLISIILHHNHNFHQYRDRLISQICPGCTKVAFCLFNKMDPIQLHSNITTAKIHFRLCYLLRRCQTDQARLWVVQCFLVR